MPLTCFSFSYIFYDISEVGKFQNPLRCSHQPNIFVRYRRQWKKQRKEKGKKWKKRKEEKKKIRKIRKEEKKTKVYRRFILYIKCNARF